MPGRKPIIATLIVNLVTLIRDLLFKSLEPGVGNKKKKTDHKKWE